MTARWQLGHGVILATLAAGSCVPPDIPTTPAPVTAPVTLLAPAPPYRIGLLVDAEKATVGGGGRLRVIDPDEGPLAEIPEGTSFEVRAAGRYVTVAGATPAIERKVLVFVATDSDAPVRLNGRDYRGTLELRRTPKGFVAINRLDLESYLLGVVGAEMGRRSVGDEAALRAQAVVSRTYAIRNQGRWEQQGFDLLGDVSDQAYVGTSAENPMASDAVTATHGEILTWDGAPIDAFFFSTCAGRTEDGTAAFAGADRPYLRSVDDHDPTGVAWCAASPRFQWTESWSRSELQEVLRRTLPAAGLPAARASDLTEMRVIERTRSGRIAALELDGRSGRTVVRGQAIRRVLAPVGGGILRSTDFTIRIGRAGGRIERVDLDGRGNGHGVGMCQWGAVGRSRAGESYETILSSYFPGTQLQHAY